MSDQSIWRMSACEQANAIATKKLSCVEAVGAALEQIQLRNPTLNAIVDDLSEPAMRDAHAHDKILAKTGPLGPLHGVPITIKEISIKRVMQLPTASPLIAI